MITQNNAAFVDSPVKCAQSEGEKRCLAAAVVLSPLSVSQHPHWGNNTDRWALSSLPTLSVLSQLPPLAGVRVRPLFTAAADRPKLVVPSRASLRAGCIGARGRSGRMREISERTDEWRDERRRPCRLLLSVEPPCVWLAAEKLWLSLCSDCSGAPSLSRGLRVVCTGRVSRACWYQTLR